MVRQEKYACIKDPDFGMTIKLIVIEPLCTGAGLSRDLKEAEILEYILPDFNLKLYTDSFSNLLVGLFKNF